MANKKKGMIITGTVIVGTLLALYLLTRKGKAAECQGVCAPAQSQIIDIIVTE